MAVAEDGAVADYWFNPGDPMESFDVLSVREYPPGKTPPRPKESAPKATDGKASITMKFKDRFEGKLVAADSISADDMDGEWIKIRHRPWGLWPPGERAEETGWVHGTSLRLPGSTYATASPYDIGGLWVNVLIGILLLLAPFGIRMIFGRGCALTFLALPAAAPLADTVVREYHGSSQGLLPLRWIECLQQQPTHRRKDGPVLYVN